MYCEETLLVAKWCTWFGNSLTAIGYDDCKERSFLKKTDDIYSFKESIIAYSQNNCRRYQSELRISHQAGLLHGISIWKKTFIYNEFAKNHT